MEDIKRKDNGTEELEEIDFSQLRTVSSSIPPIRKLIFFSIMLYLAIFFGGLYIGYQVSYNKAQEYQETNCQCVDEIVANPKVISNTTYFEAVMNLGKKAYEGMNKKEELPNVYNSDYP